MMTRKKVVRIGTNIGAALGGLVFLAFGIIPGLKYGSHGASVVLKHLLGSPLEPSLIVKAVISIGALLGIVSIASVSIVIGSIFGTALGYLVEAVTNPSEVKNS